MDAKGVPDSPEDLIRQFKATLVAGGKDLREFMGMWYVEYENIDTDFRVLIGTICEGDKAPGKRDRWVESWLADAYRLIYYFEAQFHRDGDYQTLHALIPNRLRPSKSDLAQYREPAPGLACEIKSAAANWYECRVPSIREGTDPGLASEQEDSKPLLLIGWPQICSAVGLQPGKFRQIKKLHSMQKSPISFGGAPGVKPTVTRPALLRWWNSLKKRATTGEAGSSSGKGDLGHGHAYGKDGHIYPEVSMHDQKRRSDRGRPRS